MQKQLKLYHSPFHPSMDEACGLIIQLSAPYGKDHISILISSNLTEYKEHEKRKNFEIRQFTFNEHNKDTIQATLDFQKRNILTLENEKSKIEIKLERIDTEKIQNQDFYYFEFLVSLEEKVNSPSR